MWFVATSWYCLQLRAFSWRCLRHKHICTQPLPVLSILMLIGELYAANGMSFKSQQHLVTSRASILKKLKAWPDREPEPALLCTTAEQRRARYTRAHLSWRFIASKGVPWKRKSRVRHADHYYVADCHSKYL